MTEKAASFEAAFFIQLVRYVLFDYSIVSKEYFGVDSIDARCYVPMHLGLNCSLKTISLSDITC